MNAHTPGPWTAEQNWFGKLMVVAGKTRICNAPHMDLYKMEKKLGREAALRSTTGAANAHLIAAAPDLLAALKECEAYFRPAAQDGQYLAQQRIDVIRAAIAKAEGTS